MRVIPLTGVSAMGVLKLSYLPRFWLKIELGEVGLLPEDYRDIDAPIDDLFFPAVGIEREWAVTFLRTLPTYIVFETWIAQNANDVAVRTACINSEMLSLWLPAEQSTFAMAADLAAWQALHAQVRVGRQPGQPEIIPAVSSTAIGPLGATHLPRLWAKRLLKATDFLPHDYNSGMGGGDTFAVESLGLDMAASVNYITENRPTYLSYERWVCANAEKTRPDDISAYNAAAARREKPESSAAPIRAAAGIADPDLRATVVLNDFDDWITLHETILRNAAGVAS
jgi:hypothetical protein